MGVMKASRGIRLICVRFILLKFNVLELFFALMYMGRSNTYPIRSSKHNTCFLGGVIMGYED
jgi:hypothetical protein